MLKIKLNCAKTVFATHLWVEFSYLLRRFQPIMKEWTDLDWAEIEWLKKELRDYYKPRLKRDLKRMPTKEEVDRRFREIYLNLHFTLLVGKIEGVTVQFYEIAKFSLDQFNQFHKDVEGYLLEHFGGGWFKLNIYDGSTYAMTVNYKPKAPYKWEHLIPKVP